MSYQEAIDQLSAVYAGLSPQLRQAARFVLDRPDDVAFCTMRELAARAGVHPSTMIRLARRLDYAGYNEFRDLFRDQLRGAKIMYSERARALQSRPTGEGRLMQEMAEADHQNISRTFDPDRLAEYSNSVEILKAARRIYAIGSRGSFPIAFSFQYSCSMFRDDVFLVEGRGATFSDELRDVGARDAVLAIAFSPYTRATVIASGYAAGEGARVVAITDSAMSPLARHAASTILVGCESPFFFQSVTAAQSAVQALLADLVAAGGARALAKLRESERRLSALNAYEDETPKRFAVR